MRNKLTLSCLLLCIPIFTQANEREVEEVEVEALRSAKQSLDEATLVEDGMYEVSFSKNQLSVITGTVATGLRHLRPLRNWQEYLLDMSDGKTLDEKVAYLFEHQDDFGLEVGRFLEGKFITGDDLIRKGGYAITLRNPIFDGRTLLFVGSHQDSLFMSVVQLFKNIGIGISKVPVHITITTGALLEPTGELLGHSYSSFTTINDLDHAIMMNMDKVFLDETVGSRRLLIETVTKRTSYPHVISPGLYARNAHGGIIDTSRSSFLRRILRRVGLPAAMGVGLSSLFFARDAEAQIHESQTSEDVRIEMTPEEFEQANEEIDLALDSYYSMQ